MTEQIVIIQDQMTNANRDKHVHSFVLKECPVLEVKIYNDRAEIKREIKIFLKQQLTIVHALRVNLMVQ